MSSTYNKFYKVFNGTDWDIYYLATQAGIVKETSNRIFVHVSNDQYKGTFNQWKASSVVKSYGDIIIQSDGSCYFLETETYSNDTNYHTGDKVIFTNGSSCDIYSCLVDQVAAGRSPATNPSDWNEISSGASSPSTVGFTTFDLSKPGSPTNHGHFSPSQASRLASLNLVEVTQEKNGTIQINGVSKQIIPDHTVTTNGSSHTAGKVPVWDSTSDVLAPGLSVSTTGGTGHGGVLVQTDSNGKIDTTFIPDSILGSLKYKGAWNPTGSAGAGYTPVQGDYWIANNQGDINPDGTNTGNQYDVGDWAVYNGSTWDEIDNQTKVVSVNGRTGVVSIYQGVVSDSTRYNKGEIVWRNADNSLYLCIVDNTLGSAIADATKFKRMSSPLYSSTGQNTDGAMTQKATTDALNLLNVEEPFRSYVVSSSGNYFQRITGPDGDGEPEVIDSYNVNISAIGSPINWATFASYFVDVLNNVGNTPSSVSALFIGSNGANVQTTMSANLLGWFNFTSNKVKINGVANSTLAISTFKVEALHHDVKVTANITNGRQYEIHIVDTSASKNWGSVATNGWRVVKDIFDESNTNNVSNALIGDICLETVS